MQFDFDCNDYESQELPEGEYLVVVAEAESKVTKAGHEALQLRYEVLDGEYAKRSHFDFLNLYHPTAMAQEMARAALNRITKAIGMTEPPRQSEDLVNKIMRIRIKHKPDKDGNMRAVINRYLPKGAASSKPAAQPTAAGNDTW